MISGSGRDRGFTLVEMIITIVILAIALLSVAYMVQRGLGESADTLLETRAVALGHAYLDEIMGKRFDERSAASGLSPCFDLSGGNRCSTVLESEGAENRARYDDVDDYNGLIEGFGAGSSGPIEDAEGETRSGYEDFRVEILVVYAGDDAVLGLTPTDAKRIQVTVLHTTQSTGWIFSAYKGNY